jgi:hypothetical protein
VRNEKSFKTDIFMEFHRTKWLYKPQDHIRQDVFFNDFLLSLLLIESESESYVTTDGQPASLLE